LIDSSGSSNISGPENHWKWRRISVVELKRCMASYRWHGMSPCAHAHRFVRQSKMELQLNSGVAYWLFMRGLLRFECLRFAWSCLASITAWAGRSAGRHCFRRGSVQFSSVQFVLPNFLLALDSICAYGATASGIWRAYVTWQDVIEELLYSNLNCWGDFCAEIANWRSGGLTRVGVTGSDRKDSRGEPGYSVYSRAEDGGGYQDFCFSFSFFMKCQSGDIKGYSTWCSKFQHSST